MKALVVCNAYPSSGNLYRNGFIHRRVSAYRDLGIEVEVYYHHEPVSGWYEYEFEGIHVTVGNKTALARYVRHRKFDIFLVHFAEPARVEPLLGLGVPLIVWVHGFEAEGWHRRWFNFIDDPDAAAQAVDKKNTYYETQNEFLRGLAKQRETPVTFVNVSEWFRRMVVEPDLRTEFDKNVTIPNFVDPAIFGFREKEVSQRLSILSVRPFASNKYANDQTVAAIQLLAQRPYFGELEFKIFGEGRLFKDTTKPVQKYKNVTIKNRFLTQREIAHLHADSGVFLCPTRFDSQGVSMCEAMASGLVPISTNVAAIPEFVDNGKTGLLGAPESPKDLADLIEELYFDPALFLRLSRAASESIEQKCGFEATIQAEVQLMRKQVHFD